MAAVGGSFREMARKPGQGQKTDPRRKAPQSNQFLVFLLLGLVPLRRVNPGTGFLRNGWENWMGLQKPCFPSGVTYNGNVMGLNEY